MTSISHERGHNLIYDDISIKEDLGIGGTVCLLWFHRKLPLYATKFFEIVLMVSADNGPSVSCAHNTIVCTRAGKDLISSLVCGLLTIGDRVGGALEEAAQQFIEAYDSGMNPQEFVNQTRKQGQHILGNVIVFKILYNFAETLYTIKN